MFDHLVWTKEKPTKPGIYWLRQHCATGVNGPWHSDGVVEIAPDEMTVDDKLWVWVMGGEGQEPLDDYGDECEWAGPVPKPIYSTASGPWVVGTPDSRLTPLDPPIMELDGLNDGDEAVYRGLRDEKFTFIVRRQPGATTASVDISNAPEGATCESMLVFNEHLGWCVDYIAIRVPHPATGRCK